MGLLLNPAFASPQANYAKGVIELKTTIGRALPLDQLASGTLTVIDI